MVYTEMVEQKAGQKQFRFLSCLKRVSKAENSGKRDRKHEVTGRESLGPGIVLDLANPVLSHLNYYIYFASFMYTVFSIPSKDSIGKYVMLFDFLSSS